MISFYSLHLHLREPISLSGFPISLAVFLCSLFRMVSPPQQNPWRCRTSGRSANATLCIGKKKKPGKMGLIGYICRALKAAQSTGNTSGMWESAGFQTTNTVPHSSPVVVNYMRPRPSKQGLFN